MSAGAAAKTRLRSIASQTNQTLMGRLVRSGRIPRLAFQHYFIETEGLHSRIHLQNFYSTFWPEVEASVQARIDVFDPAGHYLGRHVETIPHFGSLFLEVRDLLAQLGTSPSEGSLAIDLVPPPATLAELAKFPIPDPWALLLSTPFWIAYYDADENYMYVHSIDRFAGDYRGIPKPVSWALGKRYAVQGNSWRAGRLIDIDGLRELQVVITNHGADARSPLLTMRDGYTDATLWSTSVPLRPHGLQRVRVDLEGLSASARELGSSSFRIGLDPLPTLNGKPYVLMRYGNGPLSLHHG